MLDGVFWGVVGGTLGDPFRNEGDLGFGEWRFTFGHVGLALEQGDGGDEGALGGLVGDDGFITAVAASEEAGEIGHHVAALVFGGLVATLAVGLKERADLFPVADGGVEIDDLGFRRRGGERGRRGYGDREQGRGESGQRKEKWVRGGHHERGGQRGGDRGKACP